MIMQDFVRMRMHALYDHFPERNPVEGEPFIECYADTYVKEVEEGQKAVALLLEPRSLVGEAYDFVYEHADMFRYIFTHDSKILSLPNARLFLWGDVWVTADIPKTKGVSIVSSWKNWCPLHNARIELARHFDGSAKVDSFGSFRTGKGWDEAYDYLAPYKFSIVIENDIDDLWYTEKILNCFGTMTVPIYVGASRIGDVFNPDGILQVEDWHQIPGIIDCLDVDKEYARRYAAVLDNRKRVEPLVGTTWKDRFWKEYGSLLEGVQNG